MALHTYVDMKWNDILPAATRRAATKSDANSCNTASPYNVSFPGYAPCALRSRRLNVRPLSRIIATSSNRSRRQLHFGSNPQRRIVRPLLQPHVEKVPRTQPVLCFGLEEIRCQSSKSLAGRYDERARLHNRFLR